MKIPSKLPVYAVFVVLAVVLVLVALFWSGTCDSGDSVMHYLFARYAFDHPQNFLEHWAKPVFTILASPFAHFGFTGIKLFNVLVALLTGLTCLRIAQKLELRYSLLAVIFLFGFPLYDIIIFSGLTEPLFGLVTAYGVYLFLCKRSAAAAIVLSFLPFCRSEGLVVLCVVAVYMAGRKQWKQLPLLATGHLFFSVVGAFYYHDLLWVFNRIPYVGTGSYGHGEYGDFFVQSPFIFGVPLLALAVSGLLVNGVRIFLRDKPAAWWEEFMLVNGIFVSVFMAHVIFWKYGLFHSFGLIRVMVGILPLGALVCLRAFDTLVDGLRRVNRIAALVAGTGIVAYVLIFPFAPNPAAFNYQRDFGLKAEQVAQQKAAEFIQVNYPNAWICSSVNYLSILLDRDVFDTTRFDNLMTWYKLKAFPKGTIVVWDSWFGRYEYGIGRDVLLEKRPGLKKVFSDTEEGHEVIVCVQE